VTVASVAAWSWGLFMAGALSRERQIKISPGFGSWGSFQWKPCTLMEFFLFPGPPLWESGSGGLFCGSGSCFLSVAAEDIFPLICPLCHGESFRGAGGQVGGLDGWP
jgi:hypothetical protein